MLSGDPLIVDAVYAVTELNEEAEKMEKMKKTRKERKERKQVLDQTDLQCSQPAWLHHYNTNKAGLIFFNHNDRNMEHQPKRSLVTATKTLI